MNEKEEYNNKDLIRRRFYLSKETLAYLDYLALQQGMSTSKLLDMVVKGLKQRALRGKK